MKNLAVFTIILVVTATFVGCKNSKKTADTEPQKTEAKNEGAIVSSTLKDEKMADESQANEQPDVLQQQETNVQDRPAPNYPDSLYFRMDRTPCFGECPVYRVNIYRSGWALLEGGQFFDFEGMYSTKFNEEELNRIQKMAKDIGYAKLRHVYDAPVTDLPSSTTIVNSENIQHWVYNRMNAPDELRNFEMEMETLIKDKQWTAYSKANPNASE